MFISDEDRKQLRVLRIITYAMLVAAPILYPVVAYVIGERPMADPGSGQATVMSYILLILALVQPLAAPLIERMQVGEYRKGKHPQSTPGGLFLTISIMKMAFIEAIYLYGLVVFFLTGSMQPLLYFYPIGIVWTFICWPREATFQRFVERLEKP